MFCCYWFFYINVIVLTMLAASIDGFLLFWQPATSWLHYCFFVFLALWRYCSWQIHFSSFFRLNLNHANDITPGSNCNPLVTTPPSCPLPLHVTKSWHCITVTLHGATHLELPALLAVFRSNRTCRTKQSVTKTVKYSCRLNFQTTSWDWTVPAIIYSHLEIVFFTFLQFLIFH